MRIPAGGLKYHWPLIGPFLQGSLLIGGESSPAKHIIRYQTPGMGRGKTFNCPDTPSQASGAGEITVNYLIA